jgi:hypothetical protein
MSSIPLTVLALIAGISASSASLQQKPGAAPKPMPPSSAPRPEGATQCSLADLARADVVYATPPSDLAATADGPHGKVTDLVISTSDGQIACAALSVGKLLGTDERVILVPATAVKCTMVEERPVYAIQLTKAEIAAIAPFDAKKDGAEGLDRAVERARGLSAPSGARPKDTPKDTKGTASSSSSAYALSSQLIACSVNASDTEFGKVHDGVVEPSKQTVSYVIVSRSGAASAGTAMHVVPFKACQCACADGRTSLKLGKTSDQLKTAPEYKKPEQGLVTVEQTKAADAFFGGAKPAPGDGERPL